MRGKQSSPVLCTKIYSTSTDLFLCFLIITQAGSGDVLSYSTEVQTSYSDYGTD